MSKNIAQIYAANPSTSINPTDLIYLGKSPYGIMNDSAIMGTDFLTTFSSPQQAIFVAKNGIDTNAGSFAQPFLTISAALSYISTKSPSSNNTYTIFIYDGIYNEATLTMLPYVSFQGNGGNNTLLNITNFSFSSSYITASGNPFTNFINIGFTSTNLAIDFTTVAMGNGTNFLFSGCVLGLNNKFDNQATNGGVPILSIDNCSGNNLLIPGNILLYASNTQFDDINVSSQGYTTGVAPTTTFNNCPFNTIELSNKAIFQIYTSNNINGAPISISGTSAKFYGDILSFPQITNLPFNFSNGATLSQVNYLNSATGVSVNFTALNFTPTDKSIQGYLSGIDTRLGQSIQPYISTSASTVSLLAGKSYLGTSTSLQTYTLPTTAAVGDTYEVINCSNGGYKITQNSGQSIRIGSNITTTGTAGFISSTANGDTLKITCYSANTGFIVSTSPQGNPNYN